MGYCTPSAYCALSVLFLYTAKTADSDFSKQKIKIGGFSKCKKSSTHLRTARQAKSRLRTSFTPYTLK
jgi:hypothetical protein